MQIILLTKGQKKTISFSTGQQKTALALLASVSMLLAVFFYFSPISGAELTSVSKAASEELLAQRVDIERMREKTQNTLDGIALRVGQMQAQLTRLNSVG